MARRRPGYQTVSHEDLSTAKQHLQEETRTVIPDECYTAVTFLWLNTSCLSILCHISHIFIINMKNESEKVNMSVTLSCPTLGNPMDCSPPGSCPQDSPGKDAGGGRSSPGDLPTQGSNLGLLNCRQILYRLSNQEKYKKIRCIF